MGNFINDMLRKEKLNSEVKKVKNNKGKNTFEEKYSDFFKLSESEKLEWIERKLEEKEIDLNEIMKLFSKISIMNLPDKEWQKWDKLNNKLNNKLKKEWDKWFTKSEPEYVRYWLFSVLIGYIADLEKKKWTTGNKEIDKLIEEVLEKLGNNFNFDKFIENNKVYCRKVEKLKKDYPALAESISKVQDFFVYNFRKINLRKRISDIKREWEKKVGLNRYNFNQLIYKAETKEDIKWILDKFLEQIELDDRTLNNLKEKCETLSCLDLLQEFWIKVDIQSKTTQNTDFSEKKKASKKTENNFPIGINRNQEKKEPLEVKKEIKKSLPKLIENPEIKTYAPNIWTVAISSDWRIRIICISRKKVIVEVEWKKVIELKDAGRYFANSWPHVAFNPENSNEFVYPTQKNNLKLVNVETGKKTVLPINHSDLIYAVAWWKYIVSASKDGTVKFLKWNKIEKTLKKTVKSLAVSHDWKTLALWIKKECKVELLDFNVDSSLGTKNKIIRWINGSVNSLAWHENKLAVWTEKGQVYIIDESKKLQFNIWGRINWIVWIDPNHIICVWGWRNSMNWKITLINISSKKTVSQKMDYKVSSIAKNGEKIIVSLDNWKVIEFKLSPEILDYVK